MADPTYSVEQTTSADVPSRERADFYGELIRSYQGSIGVSCSRSEAFDWHMVRQRTSSYQIVRSRSSPFRVERTPLQIRRDPDPDYRFVLPLDGIVVIRQRGQQSGLAPGTGGVVGANLPTEYLVGEANEHIVMSIPQREIEGRLNTSAVVAAEVDLSHGLGRVVSDGLIGLLAERAYIDGRQFDTACDRLLDLLCMAILGDDRADLPDHFADVEATIRQHVAAHAGDPALTGSTIARELGWSLRQVQLVLQRAGTTPRDLIRDERLRLVRQRLRSPAFDHLSIGAIAQLSGFMSLNSLGVAFRQRYGMSPRDFRHT